jgi:hypothetical protein
MERMKTSSGVTFRSRPPSTNGSSQAQTHQRPLSSLRTGIGNFFSKIWGKPAPKLPENNLELLDMRSTSGGDTDPRGFLHVMACMHKERDERVLHQYRVKEITTDKRLFQFLKNQYSMHCGRLRKRLTLRNIEGIYFVRVSSLHTMLQ